VRRVRQVEGLEAVFDPATFTGVVRGAQTDPWSWFMSDLPREKKKFHGLLIP